MPTTIPRGPGRDADPELKLIAEQLDAYLTDHPGATADVYRQGKYNVRARVTDQRFAGLSQFQRGKLVWAYLERLPEEVFNDVTFLVTITPDEKDTGSSREFDDPTPLLSGSVRLMTAGKAPDAASAPTAPSP